MKFQANQSTDLFLRLHMDMYIMLRHRSSSLHFLCTNKYPEALLKHLRSKITIRHIRCNPPHKLLPLPQWSRQLDHIRLKCRLSWVILNKLHNSSLQERRLVALLFRPLLMHLRGFLQPFRVITTLMLP